jgi:hypothetical protein
MILLKLDALLDPDPPTETIGDPDPQHCTIVPNSRYRSGAYWINEYTDYLLPKPGK